MNPKLKAWVQVIITLSLLTFCIYVIASENADSSKLKWAFGVIGIIIGYWLK